MHVSIDATFARPFSKIHSRLFYSLLGAIFFSLHANVARKRAGHSSHHFHFHLTVHVQLRTTAKSPANIRAKIVYEHRGEHRGLSSCAIVASMELQPQR